jgi:hypothetical protein
VAVTAARALEPAPDIPIAAADSLRACLWVAIGSCIRGRLLFLLGLPVVLAGFAVAWRAMWRVAGEHESSVVDHQIVDRRVSWLPSTCLWLAVMAFVGLAAPSTIGPLSYDIAKRVYFLLGLAAVSVFRHGTAKQTRRAVTAVIVAGTALHLVTPLAVPDPNIDVWIWTQSCIQALLRGVHPYTVDARDLITNVYHLGPTATVYPYMPLTLVAFAPAYALFGDYRLLSALCVPATVALNRATGRQLCLDSRFIDATTLAFLLFPRGAWLTCFGWTEPLLVVVVSGFVYLATRAPGGAGQAIAFLLLPALKQYIVAPVLLFLAISRPRTSVVAVAVTVAAATVVPFLIWDWRPTIEGIVVQMMAPVQPRLDSTSLVALVGLPIGIHVTRWVSVVVQFLVAGIAYTRLRDHGLGGLLLASSLAMYATFLTGWQAFMNYYYLVGEMLLLTAMVLAAARPSEAAAAT